MAKYLLFYFNIIFRQDIYFKRTLVEVIFYACWFIFVCGETVKKKIFFIYCLWIPVFCIFKSLNNHVLKINNFVWIKFLFYYKRRMNCNRIYSFIFLNVMWFQMSGIYCSKQNWKDRVRCSHSLINCHTPPVILYVKRSVERQCSVVKLTR